MSSCRCDSRGASTRGPLRARRSARSAWRPALDRIDLAIAAGERVGLVGRSGSGKTTLLHVLGGLVMPTEGEVLLGGELLSSLDAAARGKARARSVAYVFQGANLLPTFTAFEKVALPARVCGARESSAGLLRLVGLPV